MNSDLFFEGKKYISARRAAQVSGYSTDYIGQLCRKRHLDSRMVGRGWFVSESSLLDYQNSFSEFSTPLIRDVSNSQINLNPKSTSIVSSNKNISDENKISSSRDIRDDSNSPNQFVYSSDNKPLIPELKKIKNDPEKVSPLSHLNTNINDSHYHEGGNQVLTDGGPDYRFHKDDSNKDSEDIIFKNRPFRIALRSGGTLFVLASIVLGIFFIKDNFRFEGFYNQSASLIKGFTGERMFSLNGIRNYVANLSLGNVRNVLTKLPDDKLSGEVEKSSIETPANNSENNIYQKIGNEVKGVFSGVKKYFTGLFGGKNKFANNEIVPLNQTRNSYSANSSKSSSAAKNISVSSSSRSLTGSSGKINAGTTVQKNDFIVASDITRREVLDLIKQYDDNNKSLIYTTSAITGQNSLITNQTISDLKNKINSLEDANSLRTRQIDHPTNFIASSVQNITSLDGATITGSSFSGTTGTFTGLLTGANGTFSGSLTVGSSLTVSGVGTSTFAGGVSANRFSSSATSTLAGLVLTSQGLTISTLDCSASGQLLQTDANGNVICGTDDTGAGGGAFAWTPTTNYGSLTNATGTPIWFQSGLQASSTSHLVYASSTALTISGNSYLGTVSSGTWNGTLIGVPYGGTGWASIQAGSIPYGNGSSALSTTTAATAGYVLAYLNGVPTWTATSTLSDITGTLSVAKGGTGQTSFGQGWLHSDGTTFTASTSPTVAYLTATSTTATSTFAWGVAANALNITSTSATSTFANGIQLSKGCVVMPNGTCLGTGTLSSAITSLAGQYSTGQIGASQTFSTSSDTNLGLTITSSGDNHLFTPSWIGQLGVTRGGTGLSAVTGGDLLFASAANTLTTLASTTGGSFLTVNYSTGRPSWVATSSLNVALSNTTGTLPVSRGGTNVTSFGGTNTLLYTTSVDTLSSIAAGTGGYVLAMINGVPTWTATSTLSDITGTLSVAKGGTGQTSFGQGWLHSDGTTFTASTSPTVAYLTATSTTATSTFAWGVAANALNITSTSATSTFANGIQLSKGCVVMPNGTCLGTGTGSVTSIATNNGLTGGTITTSGTIGLNTAGFVTNGLLTWDGSNLTATGTPNLTAGYFTATSTTATSTFTGGLSVAGSSGLTVLQNGKVGVGTASPIYPLDVRGSTAPVIRGSRDTSSTNSIVTTFGALGISSGDMADGFGTALSFGIQDTAAVNNTIGYIGAVRDGADNSGQLQFISTNAGASVTAMVVKPSGNIGIGTTTPNWNLQVAGTRPFLTLSDTSAGTDNKHWFMTSQGGNFYTGTSADLLNATSTYLTISNIGKVGLGTTSPYAKLSVVGETVAQMFTATSTNATSTFNGDINFGITSKILQGGQRFLTSSTTAAGNLTLGYQSATGLDANGGLYNTGVGYQTLGNATSTGYNTALGYQALKGSATITSVTGSNTAVGYQALLNNTTGYENSAIGISALYSNTTGYKNNAMGSNVLFSNTTGHDNNTTGYLSFFSNTTGSGNVGLGALTGYGAGTITDQRSVIDDYMTFIGYQASRDSAIASTTALTNGTAIGKNARVAQSNALVLGGTGSDTVNVAIGTTSPWAKLSIQNTYGSLTPLLDVASSTSAAYATSSVFRLNADGNVGIGTTSPYAKLSVVGQTVAEYFTATSTTATSTFAWGVAANALNITSTSATSTFANGIQLSKGCVVMPNGTCLGTGTGSVTSIATNNGLTGGTITTSGTIGLNTAGFVTNSLLAWDGSNLTATGTPNLTAGYFTATSTTATSTFKGGLFVGTTTTSNLIVDRYTGYVGIGTNAPGYKLDINVGEDDIRVNGNGNNYTGIFLRNTDVSTRDWQIAAVSNDGTKGYGPSKGFFIGDETANETRLVIDTSGNVGIGTTSPYSKLSVWGSGTGTNRLFELTNNASTTLMSMKENGTGYFLGNIGIGTTSPYAKLSVVGQTVAEYFTATSTTATSTFPLLKATTALQIGSDYITDITGTNLSITNGVLSASGGGASPDWVKETNYGVLTLTASTTIPYWAKDAIYASSTLVVQGLATFGNASTSQISATNSYLGTVLSGTWTGTAIGDAYLTKSGDWTGTLDTYNGSDLLSRANHTGTQGMATLSNYDWTFSNNYGVNNITGSTTMPLWSQGGLNASSTSHFVYASSTALTVSNGAWFTGGNIGIGTTSPYAKLSVSGDTALDSMFVNFASSSAPSLTLNYLKSATSTIPSNTNYAWSIATSTTASPIFSISTLGSGANLNATTTINGGLNLDSGALLYDYSSGITTINSLEAGPLNFDNDAGIVTAFDLPIVSASANTVESYSFNIAASSTPNLTVYGESDGAAGVKNQRIGIGTTTPWRTLSVNGTVSLKNITTAVGAGSLCLSSNNEVTYNAADTCLSSLRSTKHDIEILTISGLDAINALKPVSFVYNEGYGDDRIRYGFIAEDVASVDSHFASYNGTSMSGIDDRAIISVAVKAIKELNLNIAAIVSATATTTSASQSFASSFFDNIFARVAGWLADAGNGIEKLFAKEVRTGKLCLDDVCVTKTELQALLQNTSAAGSSASSSSVSSLAQSSSSSISSNSSSRAGQSQSASSASSSSVQSSSSNYETASSSSSSISSANFEEPSSSSESSSSEAVSSSLSAGEADSNSESSSSSEAGSSLANQSSTSSSESEATSDVASAESSSSSMSSETVSSSSSVSSESSSSEAGI